MFCLQCGAEMAIRAQVCPVCGHVYGDRERSLAESRTARADQAAPAVAATPSSAAQGTGTMRYASELGAATGLPRDLPGRFVLAVALGLAADLLLPWVSVNGVNVTPASIGAPVIVVVALLAAATLPVFTSSLSQHPVWSALPLIVGAFCAGIAGSIWLLLAPLAQIFAASFGSDPSNLALSPQGGLYLFLLGSAVLLVSGQRMLAATHEAQLADARRDALRTLQVRGTVLAHPVAPATPTQVAQPIGAAQAPQAPIANAQAMAASAGAPAPAPAEAGLPAVPGAPAAPIVPVLPGSDAWHQAPTAPTPQRAGPGGGWGKSRGPQRLR